MQRHLLVKTIVIVATVLICIFGVIGFPKNKAELENNIGQRVHLGLDLKGGSHLILQVQVQDAVRTTADHTIDSIKNDLSKSAIDYSGIDRNDPTTIDQADSIQINIHGIPAGKTSQFRSLIADKYALWNLTPVNSTDYTLRMKPSEMLDLKRRAVEQSIQTISNRVNSLGLTEPVVQQHGRADAEYEILVQLPGVDDPARVKDIIGQAAQLEITKVEEGPFSSEEQLRAQKGGVLPLNTKPAFYQRGENGGQWYLVSRSPVLVGEDLRNARADQDEFRKWETGFTISQDASKRFERFTEAAAAAKDRLAVLLDNQIKSVATVNGKISDSGRITGLGSQQEASDLALVMRSGSLPAGIVYLQESSVGPSLGADSIRAGLLAGVAGLLAVVIAMLVYYKRSGVNAVLALILNTILLIAALAYFHAVLTLPGIAGIILTIGMAVDSNVLIFERIREEIRAGKGPVAAVDAGFGKAWWTIVDTHVTTIVSCAFLFLFGTGPVRGFAVTLVIGLLANVFTAVFVSRTIFDYELSGTKQVKPLSI